MSAKYKSPSFLLPNELNTSANPANDTGINSLYSMDFDGSSDYIDLGESVLHTSSATVFTLSAWIKPRAGMSAGIIAADAPAASVGNGGFWISYDNRNTATRPANGISYNIKTSTGYQSGKSNDNAITLNAWNHVVLVLDGQATLYINGVSSTNRLSDNIGDLVTQSHELLLGSEDTLTFEFNGQIDEVAIFNRALNTTEIAALYGGTSPNIYPSNLMASNLNPIAYYPLGEQAQNSGYLSASGNEWQFPNGVLQDYVMDFDGSTDYIDAGSSVGVIGTGVRTFSVWLKTSTTSTQTILGTRNYNTDGWVIQISLNSILFYNVKTPSNRISSSTNLTDGNWYHLVIVRGKTTSTNKIYVNGSSQTLTSDNENGTDPQSSKNLLIGVGYDNGGTFYRFFNGEMSNLAIWNSDQSTNIANIYNNGSPQTTYTVNPQNWWKLNADSVYTPSVASYSTALNFGGTDYIDCGVVSAVENVSSFSMSVWVYPTNGASKSIIGNWGNPYVGVQISTSTSLVTFSVDNSNTGAGYGSTSSGLSNNNWAHLFLVFDGSGSGNLGRLKGYINGVEQTLSYTGTIPATTAAPNRAFRIGDQHMGNGLIGNISNAAIFDSALTSSQVSTLFNFGTPETNISFNPTHWWKLDNLTTGIQDSGSASNNGTNNGATDIFSGVAVTPSWKIPSALTIPTINYTTALDFDGNTDYVTAGTTSYLNNVTEMSFSVWFNLDTAADNKGIVDDQDKHFAIYTKTVSGSNYSLRININGSANRFQLTGAPFTAGKWHNLVMAFNAGTLNFYIDGNPAAYSVYSGSMPSALANSTGVLNIGRYSTLEWDGLISNAQIWTTELSSADALSIYNNGQPSTTAFGSPVSWWKLDSTTITDSAGSNNGTNNGATQVTSDVYSGNIPVNGVSTTLPSTALQQSDLQFDSPYSNYSLSFDGSDKVVIPNTSNIFDFGTNDFTVSLWCKGDGVAASQYIIGSTVGFKVGRHASLPASGTGGARFRIGSGLNTVTAVTTNIDDGNWHNVIIKRESGGVSIFTDGQAQQLRLDNGTDVSTPYTMNDSVSVGSNLFIGSYTAGAEFWIGKVDETAFWSIALTEAQALEIYNNGRPKDLTTFSGTAPISWWRLGENAYFDNNSFIVPNSISGAPNGTGSGTITTMISADAPGTYANGIGANLDILDRVGDAPLSTSNSQSYNMIPSDISPYVPAYVGNQIANNFSMSFDGVDDYVEISSGTLFDFGSNAFSFSGWFTRGNTATSDDVLFFNRKSGTTPSWQIRQNINNIQIEFNVGGVWSDVATTTNPISMDTNWHHLAITKSGTSVSIYIDGIAQTTSGTAPGTIDAGDGTTFIGSRNGSGSQEWFGKIDEVAIFDKALTAGQIFNDLYQPTSTATNQTADFVNNPNLPNPVAWYRMGD